MVQTLLRYLLILIFIIPFNSLGMEEVLPLGWRKEINTRAFSSLNIPEKDSAYGVKHASTAVISFENPSSKVITNYISEWNYIAKESSFLNTNLAASKPSWIPCIISHAERSNSLPLPHSEIAFLQQITGHKDPAKHIQGMIKDLLLRHPEEKITILLKNTDLAPCSTGDWGPGIYCKQYLQLFCDKIKAEYGNCTILVFVGNNLRDSFS